MLRLLQKLILNEYKFDYHFPCCSENSEGIISSFSIPIPFSLMNKKIKILIMFSKTINNIRQSFFFGVRLCLLF